VTFVSVETGGMGGTAAGVALEALAETLHEILEIARAVATRYGGTIVQTGDTGLVVAYGAEVAHEDDAQRAVLAALEMVDALKSVSERTAWRPSGHRTGCSYRDEPPRSRTRRSVNPTWVTSRRTARFLVSTQEAEALCGRPRRWISSA
jgi:hypothetical protein